MAVGPVDAQAPTPAPLSLVAAARTPVNGSDTETNEDGATVRWIQGFAWSPTDCGGGDTLDPCGETGPDATPTTQADNAFTPYVIAASIKCSTFGNGSEAAILRARERARQKLIAIESTLIEQELWDGTLTQAAGFGNAYLTEVAGVTELQGGNATGVVTALAELEQAIANRVDHGRGMIHATPRTVTHWAENGLVQRRGDLLLTVLDTIVVPGRGYGGTAPVGTESASTTDEDFSWAYATDIVTVRRGEISYPTTDLNTRAEVTRASNDLLVTAARFAAASFDGCVHVGVLVDHRNAHSSIGS